MRQDLVQRRASCVPPVYLATIVCTLEREGELEGPTEILVYFGDEAASYANSVPEEVCSIVVVDGSGTLVVASPRRFGAMGVRGTCPVKRYFCARN